MDRQSQSAFIIFKGQKLHGDEMVQKAQAYIESKLHEKISVAHMSSRFSVGRRNFDRRFIKATGNTPVEIRKEYKLNRQKRHLKPAGKQLVK